jgi:hypothetical protein
MVNIIITLIFVILLASLMAWLYKILFNEIFDSKMSIYDCRTMQMRHNDLIADFKKHVDMKIDLIEVKLEKIILLCKSQK